jgi:polar amino acid transport system ATP-binding protein
MSDLAHGLPGASPQIILRQVVKSFGATRVIDHLDLSIPAGQKVALIGPSGSGKSTVLRLIKGLEAYQQGSIEVAGSPVPAASGGWHWPGKSKPPLVHRVGMVFQQFNLFPHLTVQQNVTEAPLQVLKLSREEALERAHQYLGLVGLSHKADAYPAQLSGGQQQRVAIAREVLAVIRAIAHEQQMTMLLVTHEMRFAQDIADRVLFMEAGRIVADGSPNEVLIDPQNERTRRFLNLVEQR